MATPRNAGAARLRAIFRSHDADGSGQIDIAELGAAVTELVGTELPRHTMDMLMSQADEDGSGFVSFAEFVELVNVAAPEPSGGADGPEEELLTGSDSKQACPFSLKCAMYAYNT